MESRLFQVCITLTWLGYWSNKQVCSVTPVWLVCIREGVELRQYS